MGECGCDVDTGAACKLHGPFRFQVRKSGPGYDWLPAYCVVDTEKQVRVAAYDDEGAARRDCADRNVEAEGAGA